LRRRGARGALFSGYILRCRRRSARKIDWAKYKSESRFACVREIAHRIERSQIKSLGGEYGCKNTD